MLAAEAFALRFFGGAAGDRLLVINLGGDLDLTPAPEPLLAPPAGVEWALLWSSEFPQYGGQGTPPVHPEEIFRVPGNCAVVLTSRKATA